MDKYLLAAVAIALLLVVVVGFMKLGDYSEQLNIQAVEIRNTNGHLDETIAFVDSIAAENAAAIKALKEKVAALEKDDDDDDDDDDKRKAVNK